MYLLQNIKNWFIVNILKQPVGGLNDDVTDERTFGAEVIAGRVERSDIQDRDFFTIEPMRRIDQKSSDFCVGCSKCYGKEATEGVKMSWAGAYAMGCRALGRIPNFGISLLHVFLGAVRYGVPEERLWPYTGKKSHDADYKNMSQEVLDNAMEHRDGSFFIIKEQEGWDRYDLFRAYLWKLRDRKIVIVTGADNHSITIFGQVKAGNEFEIVSVDSYGKKEMRYRLGRYVDGFRYFNRREVNQMFRGYIGIDMKRSLAELLVLYNGKAVKTQDSGECYLIKDGEKHHLMNEAIAWSHNTLLFGDKYVSTISKDEFEEIPTGEPSTFEGGENRDIILRILEKLNRTDLIKE